MNLTTPKNWRKGQTLFNFFEWLVTAKGFAVNQSGRTADPFYIPDGELDALFAEFLKVHQVKP